MSEWDEDPESSEQEESAEEPATPDLKKLEKELRDTRKENQTLRSRLNETLVDKFGEDVVALIPEEVKAWERRWTLAEQFAERLAASKPATTEPAGAEETATQEEPSDAEKALAAVASGPPPSAGADGTYYTPEQIRQIGLRDPQRALRIIQTQSESGPMGELKLKEPPPP